MKLYKAWTVSIRQDLWEKDLLPGLMKGWPDEIVELLSEMDNKVRFEYLYLEEEYDGFNIVIWHPTIDFIDLANTIDFEFHARKDGDDGPSQ